MFTVLRRAFAADAMFFAVVHRAEAAGLAQRLATPGESYAASVCTARVRSVGDFFSELCFLSSSLTAAVARSVGDASTHSKGVLSSSAMGSPCHARVVCVGVWVRWEWCVCVQCGEGHRI